MGGGANGNVTSQVCTATIPNATIACAASDAGSIPQKTPRHPLRFEMTAVVSNILRVSCQSRPRAGESPVWSVVYGVMRSSWRGIRGPAIPPAGAAPGRNPEHT